MNPKIEIKFHCKDKRVVPMTFDTEAQFTEFYTKNVELVGIIKTYQKIDNRWELI